MEEIEHRGYKIVAEAYQDKETKNWVPRAMIFPTDEAQNEEMPMSWEQEFDTQQQAEDYALDGAKFYVDNYF